MKPYIHRPPDYYKAMHQKLYWGEVLVEQNLMAKAFNKLYGRRNVVLDCGYILAGG